MSILNECFRAQRVFHPGIETSFIFPSDGIKSEEGSKTHGIYKSHYFGNGEKNTNHPFFLEIKNICIQKDPSFYLSLQTFFHLIKPVLCEIYNVNIPLIYDAVSSRDPMKIQSAVDNIKLSHPLHIYIHGLYVKEWSEVDYFIEYLFMLCVSMYSTNLNLYDDHFISENRSVLDAILEKGLFLHIDTQSCYPGGNWCSDLNIRGGPNHLYASGGQQTMAKFYHEFCVKNMMYCLLSGVGSPCTNLHHDEKNYSMKIPWNLKGVLIDTEFPFFHVQNLDFIVFGESLVSCSNFVASALKKENNNNSIQDVKDISHFDIDASLLKKRVHSWKGHGILKKYYIIYTKGCISHANSSSQGLFEYIQYMTTNDSFSSFLYGYNSSTSSFPNYGHRIHLLEVIKKLKKSIDECIVESEIKDISVLFLCEIPCLKMENVYGEVHNTEDYEKGIVGIKNSEEESTKNNLYGTNIQYVGFKEATIVLYDNLYKKRT